jgi:transcriptional regulator with XRE-family HTH domain
MATATRSLALAARAFDRQARDAGDEFRERRLALSLSQEHVASAARVSRNRYGLIENGRCATLTLAEVTRVASVLGLSGSLRIYPAGPAVRDGAHARRLARFLANVAEPLRFRLEVPLPRTTDFQELRAWDAVLFGHGQRTAVELEMRLRDVQAMRRRLDLKRRDDPTEVFVLLVADTRNNRRVLMEFASLFDDLPRLRPSGTRAALSAGAHPRSGLLLI